MTAYFEEWDYEDIEVDDPDIIEQEDVELCCSGCMRCLGMSERDFM